MRRGTGFACGVWSRQQEKAWRMRRREPRSRKWRSMSVSGKEGGEKVAHFDSHDSPSLPFEQDWHIGEKNFTAAYNEGRSMTPEQVLAARGLVKLPQQVPVAPQSPPSVKTSPNHPAGLTAREVEVLRLLAQRVTDAQLARQFAIRPRTANWYLPSTYSNLPARSRSAATPHAI